MTEGQQPLGVALDLLHMYAMSVHKNVFVCETNQLVTVCPRHCGSCCCPPQPSSAPPPPHPPQSEGINATRRETESNGGGGGGVSNVWQSCIGISCLLILPRGNDLDISHPEQCATDTFKEFRGCSPPAGCFPAVRAHTRTN